MQVVGIQLRFLCLFWGGRCGGDSSIPQASPECESYSIRLVELLDKTFQSVNVTTIVNVQGVARD